MPTLQPPAAFPVPPFPPLPLCVDEEQQSLLDLKKDMMSAFRWYSFDEGEQSASRTERYSDRYTRITNPAESQHWDWRLFPSELHDSSPGKRKKKIKKTKQKSLTDPSIDPVSQLPVDETEEKSSDESDAGSEDDAVALEEEEFGEEETDYALTYFDNGEDYVEVDNDDNPDEGPTYWLMMLSIKCDNSMFSNVW